MPGMHEGEEASLTSLWLPGAQQQRKLLVTGVLATVLTMAEMYNGSVTRVLRYMKRSCAAAFAQYLEDQGGFPLFTIEGNEPEVIKATWNLPVPASQQKDINQDQTANAEEGPAAAAEDESQADTSSSSDLPNFFASTKFFACLDLLESKELFEATEMVKVQPKEVLFRNGEDSQSGIFIVVEGGLGVYLDEGDELRLTNILRTGESVGDLDVLDGAMRSITCIAMEEGATLVNVPRDLFISFIIAKPRTLQIYLHKAMARLWRVAHFVLTDFLELSLEEMPANLTTYPAGIPATAPSALTASMHLGLLPDMSGGSPTGESPKAAAMAPTASAVAKLPWPQGKEKGSVRFAPRLEKVSEGQSTSSTEVDLADSPAASPPIHTRPSRLSVHGDHMVKFSDAAGFESSFGVQMSTPFRNAPLPADGDIDGALEQMSSFANQSAQTTADEELYSSSVTGQQGIRVSPRGQEKAPTSPRGASTQSIASRRAADSEKADMLSKLRSTAMRTHGASRSSGAQSSAARRSFSLRKNLSQHLDLGTSAVPTSARLPAVALNGQVGSQEEASPLAPAQSDTTDEEQAPGLESVPTPELLSDAEILSSIKSTMTRKQTMSLPLHLLKGNPSLDALENALRAESTLLFPRAQSMRKRMVPGSQATLASGWDVISPEEGYLTEELQERLQSCRAAAPAGAGRASCGQHVQLRRGELLHDVDKTVRHFYFLIEALDAVQGNMLAERPGKGKKKETALLGPGSVLGAAAYLSSTRSRACMRAATSCRLAAFGAQELEALLEDSVDAFVDLLLLAGRALGPIIRRFISLGLNRVWTKAGDTVYRQGEPAESLYILISGRLRLLRADPDGEGPMVVEEEVGRGEAVGAVWALTGGHHDTTSLCARDSEFVRMSRGAFEVLAQQNPRATSNMLEGMARRISAASSARTKRRTYTSSSRQAGTSNSAAVSLASRSRSEDEGGRGGEIVTIALVPAGSYASWLAGDNLAPAANAPLGTVGDRVPGLKQRVSGFAANGGAATLAVRKVADALKNALEELFGPTLHLNASTLEVSFKTAFQRLHTTFYRSKLTSWMAAQEEDYRFIILEADAAVTPWSRICISHADCVLLVGAEEASPQVNLLEDQIVWAPMGPPSEAANIVSSARGAKVSLLGPFDPSSASWSYSNSSTGINAKRGSQTQNMENLAAQMRRVEILLLHQAGSEPQGTLDWLKPRPLLARHHHVRLSHDKDMARVARWMAGKAVGLVLSGGGSRGLAHLGVLHALDDAGVPIDVIGGTSQGAFMAALYAQGLAWERMHEVVREYAGAMGSVRHLLSDLTLPIISVFSGAGFDRIIRQSFTFGAQRIEDLWLSFFCMTTNMTRGEPTVHQQGLLWKLVRASMTIVGLIPPVYENGDLLIDGGYLNNMPVDVMRGLGVDTVIVVDVEDRDDSVWHNLTPLDGGLSGWHLLWDRWCPIPSLRFNIKVPRYSQMIAALTWMSHSQNLRRMAREHPIDLYMQPPVTRFRLLDYHLMDRIVRDSNRYAWAAISEWQCHQGINQGGRLSQSPAQGPSPDRHAIRRTRSVACMTQLQAKQKYGYDASPADSGSLNSPEREGSAGAQEGPAKADAPAEQKQRPPSLSQQRSAEGRETAALSRTQSAGSRRSFDSLTGARSAAVGALPQPYRTSPTSHEVAKQQSEQAARSAPHREGSTSQPMKSMPPPSLASLKESSSPEGRTLGSSGQDEAASPQQGSSQLSSAPIVLSRQNSSSSEEEGASEPEAAGQLSVSSEEAESGGESAQTTVRAPDLAHRASEHKSNGVNWRDLVQINGDTEVPRQETERPLSARSFARSRSGSFSKGLHTGQGHVSSSGLEDMRGASTGLVNLPEQATNLASAPIRIPVPEMRRPSLPPGRGSLADVHSGGTSSLPRQLSSHPSHALPAGNEGQGSPPLYAIGYSGKRRNGGAVNDQSTSSFPGIFEFPEAKHGT